MGKYHDILGVEPGASDSDIKKAFRALAKKYHPDTSTEPDAKAKYLEIVEARDGLAEGRSGPDINADAQDYARNHFGMDPMDIIREVARQGRVFNQMTENAMDNKLNVVQRIQIPVKKFLQGGLSTIEYNTPHMDRPGMMYYEHYTKTFTVPAGTVVGHAITFPGEGPKNTKGERGDLILQLFAGPDGPYEIHNHIDIVANIRIDPFEMMIGGIKKVLHPDGKTIIKVEVNSGTSENRVYTGLGDGLISRSGEVGDFLVQMHLDIPVLNEKQRDVLRTAWKKIKKLEGIADAPVLEEDDETVEIET